MNAAWREGNQLNNAGRKEGALSCRAPSAAARLLRLDAPYGAFGSSTFSSANSLPPRPFLAAGPLAVVVFAIPARRARALKRLRALRAARRPRRESDQAAPPGSAGPQSRWVGISEASFGPRIQVGRKLEDDPDAGRDGASRQRRRTPSPRRVAQRRVGLKGMRLPSLPRSPCRASPRRLAARPRPTMRARAPPARRRMVVTGGASGSASDRPGARAHRRRITLAVRRLDEGERMARESPRAPATRRCGRPSSISPRSARCAPWSRAGMGRCTRSSTTPG